jgi:hypothetical protein
MNEIKYTTDGKKVVVIGNLNTQEKIVQEVFVINDSEIPSGQNFVVKDLHDAPAISWKEKNLKEMEQRHANRTTSMEREMREIEERYKRAKAIAEQKCSFLAKFIDSAASEGFDTLRKFISGDIKYIVTTGYIPDILDYDSQELDTSFGDKELKLLTLFGKSDGTLLWGINQYRDGSGGNTYFYPATTYDEAREIFKSGVLKYGSLNEYIIKAAKKHGIELDAALLSEYKKKQKDSKEQGIEDAKKRIEKLEGEILEVEKL